MSRAHLPAPPPFAIPAPRHPLSFRRTELATVFAYTSLADWTVLDDDQPVGRIYEEHAPARPELAWFWSVVVMVDPRVRVPTSGKAATFEQAKADFTADWDAFKE
jgi:hypothetical protein